MPNGLSISTWSSSAPRSCACTSGAPACLAAARASATGAAPTNPLAANGTLEPLVAAIWILYVWQRRVAVHLPGPAHALSGGLSLDRVAIPSRLRHFPLHKCHFRHQLGSRAGPRAWCYPERGGKRVTRTLESSSPTPSRPRASVTNGSSMTGKCSFISFCLIPSSVLRTLISPLLVPPGGAPHTETSRAPRLLCQLERQSEFQEWDTPCVHNTFDVLTPEVGTTALGSAFGSREHINERAWESVRACDEMRSAIGSVDHAPTVMVLTRQCADVSKLMYHMRINGDLLDQDLLVTLDGHLRASVSPCSAAGHNMLHLRRTGPPQALGIALDLLPARSASRLQLHTFQTRGQTRVLWSPPCRSSPTSCRYTLSSLTSTSFSSVSRRSHFSVGELLSADN